MRETVACRMIVCAASLALAPACEVVEPLGRWERATCEQLTAEGPGAVRAVPAARWDDAIGLTIDVTREGSTADVPRLTADLARLHIRHLRTDAIAIAHGGEPVHRALATKGVRTQLQLHVNSDVGALVGSLGDALESVQVPTPGDASSGQPQVEQARMLTEYFASSLTALEPQRRPALVGPFLVYREGNQQVGDLSALVTHGTVQFGLRPPGGSGLTSAIAEARQWYGTRPIFSQQHGRYPTLPNAHGGSVTENVQAKYTLRAAFSVFRNDIARVYLPVLYDRSDSGQGAGLVREDDTLKPAYLALEHIGTLLSAGKTASSSLAFVPIAVADTAPLDVHQTLFQIDRRTFALVAWREVQSGDDDVAVDVPLRIDVPVASASEHRLRDPKQAARWTRTTAPSTVWVSDWPTAWVFELACR